LITSRGKNGTVIPRHTFSLNEAADALLLERVRLIRLGRYFKLAPGDKCLPADVIARASFHVDEDTRYRILLDWLLQHGSSASGGTPEASS
jgi:hypothetical protein